MSGLDSLLDSAGKALEVVPNLYDDAAQPALREVGKTGSILGRAINAALESVQLWTLNKEFNIERTKILLAKELENVEPERIVPPEPYVFVPAAQAISYCMDSEELRNMFAKLLAKSMVKETKFSVHPSYVDIIKQMSPIDACILKLFEPSQQFPVAEIRLMYKDGGYIVIATDVFIAAQHLSSIANSSKAISNLHRLGLIKISYTTRLHNQDEYKAFEVIVDYKNAQTMVDASSDVLDRVNIGQGLVSLTTLGIAFTDTCIN